MNFLLKIKHANHFNGKKKEIDEIKQMKFIWHNNQSRGTKKDL